MFFPSTVTLYPYVSKDAHHKITYSTTPSYPSCKYAKKDQVVKDENGKDILTVAWLQFPIGTSISKNDKIVLPDGTTAPALPPRIIHYPHNGLETCIEVYLGKESI
jgi:hypothetical protein